MSTTTLVGQIEAVRNDLEKQVTSSSSSEKTPLTPPPPPLTSPPTKEFLFLLIPVYLRYKPGESIHFGLAQICFLSVGTIFLVANLFYYQPLLIEMSETFNVSHQSISTVPTLIEAGYALGTLLMCPFVDITRRRQFLLVLIMLSASLTVGLALTRSFLVFQILSFLTGMCSISPQIIVGLVKDHAHPSRKSLFSAIVLAGYIAGVVIARLIGGVLTYLLSWRYVYYFAFGMQYAVLLLCYYLLPDFPPRNGHLTYGSVLSTMLWYATREPAMVQAELVNMALGAGIASYSVTLTFLLGGPSFNFTTLKIGLFGLTEIAGILMSTFAKHLVDCTSPWKATLIASFGFVLFQTTQTFAGSSALAPLIVACVGLDALKQLQYISLAASVYTISVESVSHLNPLLVFSYYLGQLIGTAVGSEIFVDHGWQFSAAFGMAWYGFQIIVILLRGPNCDKGRWIGY